MYLSWRKSLLVILLVILITASIVFGLSWKQFLETPLASKPITFDIPPGSSIHSVSKKLHSMGVLKHPNYFVVLAFLNGAAKQIKAGEYRIDPGLTPKQLLVKIANGKVVLHPFTIVEGWTLKQVITSAKNNQFLRHTLDQNNLAHLSGKLGCPIDNLEGCLYPDTYLFARGVNDSVVLKKAYNLMQKKLSKAWQNRDNNLPYKTPYEALIVASLIEKETAQVPERSKISGVILRRIQNNMLLQIDASVIYGLGGDYQQKLTRTNLKTDTPFNTYIHKGLPPSPIAMPSISSIIAALHPQPGSELYYVAKGDGSHEFTNSLDEHRKAIKKYRPNFIDTISSASESESEKISLLFNQHDPFEHIATNISWFEDSTATKMLTSSKSHKSIPHKDIKKNKVTTKSLKHKVSSKTKKNQKSIAARKQGSIHVKPT